MRDGRREPDDCRCGAWTTGGRTSVAADGGRTPFPTARSPTLAFPHRCLRRRRRRPFCTYVRRSRPPDKKSAARSRGPRDSRGVLSSPPPAVYPRCGGRAARASRSAFVSRYRRRRRCWSPQYNVRPSRTRRLRYVRIASAPRPACLRTRNGLPDDRTETSENRFRVKSDASAASVR